MPANLMGYSVWITTGDTVLEEYKTEQEDDVTIRCYIPSEANEQFQIRWSDHSQIEQSVVACYMDGRAVGGMPSYPRTTGCNDGVRTAQNKVKPFRFAPLVTTDDDDLASPDGADPDLGCIQVEIHRIAKRMAKDTRGTERGQVHDVGPVHERSKKLGGHVVTLGEERVSDRASMFVAPRFIDDGPRAVFRFIYRPRALLLARGIIPPPGAVAPDTKPNIKQEVDVKPQINTTEPAVKAEPSSSQIPSRRTRSSAGTTPRQNQLTPNERRTLRSATTKRTFIKAEATEPSVKEEPARRSGLGEPNAPLKSKH